MLWGSKQLEQHPHRAQEDAGYQALGTAVATKQRWDQDGCGFGVSGDAVSEMLHHCEWVAKKCAGFFEQKRMLEAAFLTILLTGHDVTIADVG
jgi:hypothetical protein